MYYGLLIYLFIHYQFILFSSVVNAALSLSDAPVTHQQLVEMLFKD